jgi:ribonuclease HI
MIEAKIKGNKVTVQAKLEHWQGYVSSLDGSESLSKVWKKIKRMKQHYNPAEQPFTDDNNTILKTAEDKAEAFASTFSKASNSVNLPEDMRNSRRQYERKHSLVDPIPDNTTAHNRPITGAEVDAALGRIKKINVKEGGDKVSYRMLRELPTSFRELLLSLYQKCWEQGVTPAGWKHAIVTPIPKQGKPRREVNSYRPISLTSHIGKVYERIIKARLEYVCEKDNLIPLCQAGFRRGRGVTDHIVHLASRIRRANRKRRALYTCLFDIHRAYDTVWHTRLLEKLKKLGFSGNLYFFIKSFLSGRTFQVRWNDTLSSCYSLDMGVPQGSVIAPLLFNIMLSDINTVDAKGATITLYADDLAIWKESLFRKIGHNNRNRLFNKTNKIFQQAINNIARYMHQNGFILSASKTVFIVFTISKLKLPPDLYMKVGGERIFPSNQAKYLGVWFSRNGKWGKHVTSNIEKANKAIGLLRVLKHTLWASQPQTMVRLASALVRSRLVYGLEAAFDMSASDLKRLAVADARAIKIALGLPKATPQYLAYRDSGLLPIPDQIRLQCAGYSFRCQTIPNSTDLSELENEDATRGLRPAPKGTLLRYFTSPLIDEAGVAGLSAAPRPLHPYPPWILQRPVVVTDVGGARRIDSLAFLGTLTKEHIEQNYKNSLQIFTDGSVMGDAVGAAFHIPGLNICKKFTLPKVSIFTAEMLAILMALQHINDMPVCPYSIVVLTDSLSSLMALQSDSDSSREDMIREIGVVVHQLITKGTRVTLQWIPSHVGVAGNEVVDRLAKEAARGIDATDVNIRLSYSDIKCRLKVAAWALWAGEFSRTRELRRYDLDPSPPTKHGVFLSGLPGPVASVAHRLRCDVWRTIFVPKKCACGAFVSPNHIIFQCPDSRELFKPLLARLAQVNLHPTLASISRNADLLIVTAELVFKSPAATMI